MCIDTKGSILYISFDVFHRKENDLLTSFPALEPPYKTCSLSTFSVSMALSQPLRPVLSYLFVNIIINFSKKKKK